jgi:hypothetical protein
MPSLAARSQALRATASHFRPPGVSTTWGCDHAQLVADAKAAGMDAETYDAKAARINVGRQVPTEMEKAMGIGQADKALWHQRIAELDLLDRLLPKNA